MATKEDIIECIRLKLIANARYDGKHVIIAPLVVGQVNNELKALCLHVAGYSKSKINGTSKSDFRWYDLDKLTSVEMTLTDFDVSVTKEYLTKNFDKVIKAID